MRARLVAVTAAVAATVLSAQAAWMPLSSPEGRFSAQFPSKAQYFKQEEPLDDGSKLLVHLYGVEQNNMAYLVSYNDYDSSTPAGQAQGVLQAVGNGVAGSVSGKIVKSEATALGKVPGRKFLIQTPKGQMHVRAYLHGKRLYQLLVITPTGKDKSPEVEKFFASFKITS